ncbi:MAG: hypothetical protein KA821_01450 [Chitinophagaceae bacterium]|nr:hypothetical protein [Chitinophagaceae bacterium]
MHIHKPFHHFWHSLRKPGVFIFIVIGVLIIFLTFLTTNNALEIAISGLASVFIGIGVNNFTTQQTHYADELQLQKNHARSLKLLELLQLRMNAAHRHLYFNHTEYLGDDLDELDRIVDMLKQLLDQEKPLS